MGREQRTALLVIVGVFLYVSVAVYYAHFPFASFQLKGDVFKGFNLPAGLCEAIRIYMPLPASRVFPRIVTACRLNVVDCLALQFVHYPVKFDFAVFYRKKGGNKHLTFCSLEITGLGEAPFAVEIEYALRGTGAYYPVRPAVVDGEGRAWGVRAVYEAVHDGVEGCTLVCFLARSLNAVDRIQKGLQVSFFYVCLGMHIP